MTLRDGTVLYDGVVRNGRLVPVKPPPKRRRRYVGRHRRRPSEAQILARII